MEWTEELARLASAWLFRTNQRNLDQVLAQEPDLQFVGAENIAHDQVVGAIVAQIGGAASQLPAVANNSLMSIQEPGDLHWHLFPAARRTFDACGLGDVGGHGQRNSTQ